MQYNSSTNTTPTKCQYRANAAQVCAIPMLSRGVPLKVVRPCRDGKQAMAKRTDQVKTLTSGVAGGSHLHIAVSTPPMSDRRSLRPIARKGIDTQQEEMPVERMSGHFRALTSCCLPCVPACVPETCAPNTRHDCALMFVAQCMMHDPVAVYRLLRRNNISPHLHHTHAAYQNTLRQKARPEDT